MTLRSDRHLATLCSSTALLLRGRLVDKAPGARLLIKARALHSDAHRRSRIYGRNRIPHSNLRQVLARLGPYMLERKRFELPVLFWPSDAREGSDSATTARTPPGLASRARVTSKWPSNGNSTFMRSGTLTISRRFASLHFVFPFCQNQQFATHTCMEGAHKPFDNSQKRNIHRS